MSVNDQSYIFLENDQCNHEIRTRSFPNDYTRETIVFGIYYLNRIVHVIHNEFMMFIYHKCI